MEISPTSDPTVFSVKRSSQGDTFTGTVNLLVLLNQGSINYAAAPAVGSNQWNYTLAGSSDSDFKQPLVAKTIKVYNNTNVTSVEVALKVDGTVCGITGKWPSA